MIRHWLCRIGWHRWNLAFPPDDTLNFTVRTCRRCGRKDVWIDDRSSAWDQGAWRRIK